MARIARSTSLSGEHEIDNEIEETTAWTLTLMIPNALIAEVAAPHSPRLPAPGVVWPANFYKCADASSHPHWGAWSSIGDKLNFHQPERFGRLVFGPLAER